MRDAETYYQAMLARDYRFDGKFFVGVKTTGVYCRPICPAKPKRQNVEFFTSARQAERAGYRPCLRCRPECAPLSAAWAGTSAVVERALKEIARGGLLEGDQDQFAARFGLSARHLRRLFVEELGQTPQRLHASLCLDFARKLLSETSLPITQIAASAGFSSLRRFNDAFKIRFHRAPSQIRKARSKASADGYQLKLAFRPPLDWTALAQFHGSHALLGIEHGDVMGFERVFELAGHRGFFRLSPDGDRPNLRLTVITDSPQILFKVVQRVRRMFDLDSDPLRIANHFADHKVLARLQAKTPGLRLPRGWDPFETAIQAILGQLVSIPQAQRLMGQVIQRYGREVIHPKSGERVRIFPTAEVLSRADFNGLGTTQKRKSTLREFARRVQAGQLSLSEARDPETLRQELLGIPGIGPWTAEYIRLRALGDANAFPATDLILKRALQKHPELQIKLLEPWRSYAALYLWQAYSQELSKRKVTVK